MAVIESVSPHYEQWKKRVETLGADFSVDYNRELDILSIVWGAPRPAIAYEYDEGIVLHADMQTDDVVSMEIQEFRRNFLPRYPELEQAWRRAMNPLSRLFRPFDVYHTIHDLTVRIAQKFAPPAASDGAATPH